MRRRARRWLTPGVLVAAAVGEGSWLAHAAAYTSAGAAAIVLLGVAWVVSPLAFPAPAAPGSTVGRQCTVVYWRPGCTYCLRLRWSLGRFARRATWVDIWADEEAAKFVRQVNDGNETVPTVVVDGEVRTNPDVAWVRRSLSPG